MNSESTVFYRKWRPRRFDDMVGQEHIVKTLKRAVLSDRVAHAYMFAGPRGVGKTSMARILAKTLNCLNRVDGEADNQCENCVAVDKNNMIDLLEVDAASNRGIDSIRGLRDSANFRPAAAAWKVYIIDEFHMLTEEAFNALLKTLEEPPSSVIMILATTDAHKVPATIISRCQRFDFERLGAQPIAKRLNEICAAENIKCSEAAMALIVSAAWGSLRDAENTLEQLALGIGGDDAEITEQDAAKLLGLGNRQASIDLAQHLIGKNIGAALAIINAEVERGVSPVAIQKGVIEVLRSALLLEAGVTRLFENDAALTRLADSLKPNEVKQHLAFIFQKLGEVKLKGEMLPSLPLELAIFRICVEPEQALAAPPQTAPPRVAQARPAPAPAPRPRAPQPAQRAVATPQPVHKHEPAPAAADKIPVSRELEKLCRIITNPPNNQQRLASILMVAKPLPPRDGFLYLRFKNKSLHQKFQDAVKTEGVGRILRDAVDAVYGPNLKMKAVYSDENNEIEDGETVRQLMQIGGKVLERKNIDAQPH